MQIAGFQKLTLLDYPGKLAAMVFTPSCNFRCGFCHNPELVNPALIKKETLIPEEVVFKHLEKRKKVLDGLVITGGEPTLQRDLEQFMQKVKAAGFLVKLDTNGTNPEILKKLLAKKLVDFIAMDIKGSFDNYAKICGVKVDTSKIKKSINLILKSDVDYEFRTTVLPKYHDLAEMEKIGKMISGAKRFYLQKFERRKVLKEQFKGEKTYGEAELKELAEAMGNRIQEIGIRV